MQEKFDGVRRMIIKKNGSIKGVNRKGLEVAIPGKLQAEIAELPDCTLDGEMIGEKLVVFDMINLEKEVYFKRYTELYHTIKSCDASVIKLAEVAWDTYYKKQFFRNLKSANAEGIVFKDIQAPYTPGRPASGGTQVKFKFTQSASCIVESVNKTKRSVLVAVLDPDSPKGHTVIGNVTVYPNQEIPKVKDIVEVKYLYAYQGGSLYQPVLLGVRTDIDLKDCTIKQLKYKKEETNGL